MAEAYESKHFLISDCLMTSLDAGPLKHIRQVHYCCHESNEDSRHIGSPTRVLNRAARRIFIGLCEMVCNCIGGVLPGSVSILPILLRVIIRSKPITFQHKSYLPGFQNIL